MAFFQNSEIQCWDRLYRANFFTLVGVPQKHHAVAGVECGQCVRAKAPATQRLGKFLNSFVGVLPPWEVCPKK